MTKDILIVEDDATLGPTLKEFLETEHFNCQLVSTVQAALENFRLSAPRVALLDIGLPDGDGLNLAKQLRVIAPTSVLLFISAQSDPEIRLAGLELGAQDYITKPFELKELSLRLKRILKTENDLQELPEVVSYGPLKMALSRYEVTNAQGEVINLSQKECAILKLLYQKPGSVISRDEIIDEVWGEKSFPSNRTVDNYIVNLRKWCDTDPNGHIKIETIRGIGYKLLLKDKHGNF